MGEYCLLVYAGIGSKGTYSAIDEIKNIKFNPKTGSIEVEYIDNIYKRIHAFSYNTNDNRYLNISSRAVKIEKFEGLEKADKRLFECITNANYENYIDFDMFYTGFVPVSESEAENYAMMDYYIITNEEQWEEWRKKYISYLPYFIDDYDWKNYCILTYAGMFEEPYSEIKEINSIWFDPENNTIEVKEDYNKTGVYAVNSDNVKYMPVLAVKMKKFKDFENLDKSLFEYNTYSNITDYVITQ